MEIEQTFFPGTRRHIDLKTVSALRATNDERRVKLTASVPLIGGALVGMPGWLHDAFTAIAKDNAGIKSLSLDVSYNGMNVNVHATDQSDRELQLPNAQLQKFQLVRQGPADDPAINLAFTMYVQMSAEAWEWAGRMIGSTFFASFQQTQSEIFGAASVEDEAPEDDAQLTLEEQERREAVSPANDAEWATAHKPPKRGRKVKEAEAEEPVAVH